MKKRSQNLKGWRSCSKEMYSVPDHPVIRNMERTGYPDGFGPRVCCQCDECGEDIYEGETAYRLGGKTYCSSCVEDGATAAEYL